MFGHVENKHKKQDQQFSQSEMANAVDATRIANSAPVNVAHVMIQSDARIDGDVYLSQMVQQLKTGKR